MTQIPAQVDEWLRLIESGEHRANKYVTALTAYLRRVFDTEDLIVETERAEKYLSLEKYLPFELFPWQRAIVILWLCTYRAPAEPRWDTLALLIGRGGGKDGTIAFTAFCLTSPYNPVQHYNVDICANNEAQAVQPVQDLTGWLERPGYEAKLGKFYYHTKEIVKGKKNLGTVKGHTNNPKGRDGLRSGVVIMNEVHAFENYDNIKVFRTGLGKVAEPRMGYFSSDGDVSDGPYDDLKQRGARILLEGEPDNGMLPLIYCLDEITEVNDPANWVKANPSLPYLPTLRKEIEKEYRDWLEHPDQNTDLPTKRMGCRDTRKETSVTDYDKILVTKKTLPDLNGWSCTVGIDYAQLNDWAAVNLHFVSGDQRYDINHAWICGQSHDLHRIKPPWRDWCAAGHCTYVDDVSIPPEMIAEYIAEAGQIYNIVGIALDNYRYPLLAKAMTAIGFDAKDKERLKLVRPSDIMMVEPIIQECFDRGLFSWGDNPVLRWAVNNTKRVRSSRKIGSDTGNFYYAKIEPKSRKTDPWMALVASMVIEEKLMGGGAVELPDIPAFVL